MPVLSCLRSPAAAGVRAALAQVKRAPKQTNPARKVWGESSMLVRSSEYQRYELRDNFVYFMALGVVPLAIFTTYKNIFEGPAELRDIPEDYVPEPYEYHKGPVQRFIAKYILIAPEKQHERSCYYVYKLEEMRKTSINQSKWLKLKTDRDEKGWFYIASGPPIETTEKLNVASAVASSDLYYPEASER